jgi:hypothetical protein
MMMQIADFESTFGLKREKTPDVDTFFFFGLL